MVNDSYCYDSYLTEDSDSDRSVLQGQEVEDSHNHRLRKRESILLHHILHHLLPPLHWLLPVAGNYYYYDSLMLELVLCHKVDLRMKILIHCFLGTKRIGVRLLNLEKKTIRR